MRTRNAVSIRDLMSTDILAVGLEDMLRGAARRISERRVGAAIVEPDTGGSRPGITTERDVLRSVGAGQDPDHQRVADNFTPDAVAVPPDSSLQQAAEATTSGGFRHLVVRDGDETVGVVSIRAIVGHWARGEPARLGNADPGAMSTEVLAVGPEDTLQEAARLMTERGVASAMVEPVKQGRPPAIVSAHEVLHSVGAGQNPEAECVGDHLAPRMTFSAPDWSLSQAAEAMIKGGFQHMLPAYSGGRHKRDRGHHLDA